MVRWVLPLGLAAIAIFFEWSEHIAREHEDDLPELRRRGGPLRRDRAGGRLRHARLGRAPAPGLPGDVRRARGREPGPRGARWRSARGTSRTTTAQLAAANADLAAANAELRQLDRLKSEFVSLVSHQLRAPLTNIRGALEIVGGDARLPAGPEPADAADPDPGERAAVGADPDDPRRVAARGRPADPEPRAGRGGAAARRELCRDARRGSRAAVDPRGPAGPAAGLGGRAAARGGGPQPAARTRCTTRRPRAGGGARLARWGVIGSPSRTRAGRPARRAGPHLRVVPPVGGERHDRAAATAGPLLRRQAGPGDARRDRASRARSGPDAMRPAPGSW